MLVFFILCVPTAINIYHCLFGHFYFDWYRCKDNADRCSRNEEQATILFAYMSWKVTLPLFRNRLCWMPGCTAHASYTPDMGQQTSHSCRLILGRAEKKLSMESYEGPSPFPQTCSPLFSPVFLTLWTDQWLSRCNIHSSRCIRTMLRQIKTCNTLPALKGQIGTFKSLLKG